MNWDWFIIPVLILICAFSAWYLVKGSMDQDDVEDELAKRVAEEFKNDKEEQ